MGFLSNKRLKDEAERAAEEEQVSASKRAQTALIQQIFIKITKSCPDSTVRVFATPNPSHTKYFFVVDDIVLNYRDCDHIGLWGGMTYQGEYSIGSREVIDFHKITPKSLEKLVMSSKTSAAGFEDGYKSVVSTAVEVTDQFR